MKIKSDRISASSIIKSKIKQIEEWVKTTETYYQTWEN